VRSIYLVAVTIHVLSAVIWLGGMITFALLAPILRRVGDDAERQFLFQTLGERFRIVGWLCITVLLITGVGQLQMRGWWGAAFWGAPRLWSSALGHALVGKLATVVLMVVVQAVHDFHFGPKAGRVRPGTPQALALRRTAAWLARINAFAGVVLIWFAVRLARGG
jgi:putative copper export protein